MVTAANGKRLMIECGVAWKKIQKALNYDLGGIEACLLSHEHKDHSKAVIDVMSAGVDVYTSAGTLTSLGITEDCPQYRRAKIIANKTLIKLPSFQVFVFDVHHDAEEPLGFIIREIAINEFMLFATDTSHIEQRFAYPFSIIAIECSYDVEILNHGVETGDINETLAKRLLTSHLEKSQAMRYIGEFCNLTKCQEIHLLHLGKDNIDKEQTRIDFEKKFFIKTVIL
jgi:phosphoribosyl 1,2-cyclic phosphodiesterase